MYLVMIHTSNVRSLVEANHWLSINLGGKTTRIRPRNIDEIAKYFHKRNFRMHIIFKRKEKAKETT
jgi:hypothetical protein